MAQRLLYLLRPAREHPSGVAFAMLCMLVMAVSVHDGMLVVLNADVILEVERNPVGRWLIDFQHGEVWLFVLLKLFCTALVCSILAMLYEFRAHLALAAVGGIALFQMTLLCYLQLGWA